VNLIGVFSPLRVGGTEKFCVDPTVGPRLKIWTRDQRWKK